MNFQQIRPQKLYEKVAEQIKQMIIDGELKPGDKLPSVQVLAEQLQVGRSAVREALSALQAMSLIELKQGEGTFVKQVSVEEILGSSYSSYLLEYKHIESLLEVRKIIETSAVKLAAERRDLEDINNIQTALKHMELDLESDTHGEEADWMFHFAISKATKNDMLIYIFETIADAMKKNLKDSRIILYKKDGMPQQLLEEHTEIFNAIKNKEGKLAAELLYNHLDQVEINIKKLSGIKEDNR